MTNDTIYDTITLGAGANISGGRRNIMPDIQKLILKMKRQPNGIRFQELAKVLEYKGYTMKAKKRYVT